MFRWRVTTPYCSGLSLLHGGRWVRSQTVQIGNHPLLFGTVSPTYGLTWPALIDGTSNHPLLFGTVSPTYDDRAEKRSLSLSVTTPYCSGLSLLQKLYREGVEIKAA